MPFEFGALAMNQDYNCYCYSACVLGVYYITQEKH